MDLGPATLLRQAAPLLARATTPTAYAPTKRPTSAPTYTARKKKPSLLKKILPVIIVIILLIIVAVAVILFLRYRKKKKQEQQQPTHKMEETYPPPVSADPYSTTAPNPGLAPAPGGSDHEMQNQPNPQGAAADYYNSPESHQAAQNWQAANDASADHRQEGQQQPQPQPQGGKDNKKMAMDLAKKGWAMYKETKHK